MAETKTDDFEIDESKLEEMIAESDTGVRNPKGSVGAMMFWVAFSWAIFQLWIASPFMYLLSDYLPVLSNTATRSIHLAFAMFLGFLAYPAFKSSPRDYIPKFDWILAGVSIVVSLYLWMFARELADHAGLPTIPDLIVSGIGIILVLEAARRTLSFPLMIIALIFLGYVFFGYLAPDVMSWKGVSFSRVISHFWIAQEGVFGVALGVSTGIVFLFVLFGSLLGKAGAGNYFIWVAFTLMGHLRGGSAKAAFVSSALVASSTNRQFTPPVMGAVAFLMIEFVGISYIEMTYAFLPAIIFYIALVYIVHLEACKAGFESLPRKVIKTFLQSAFTFMTVVMGIFIMSLTVNYGFGWLFGWLKGAAGDWTPWISGGLFFISYLFLLSIAVKYPDLGRSDEIDELPESGPIVKSGLYFLLPVIVLIWLLTGERLSPALAAFWASLAMIFILFTHKFIKGVMRGEKGTAKYWTDGWSDFKEGMVAGSRNMISIGIATAAAGLIIGAVTLA